MLQNNEHYVSPRFRKDQLPNPLLLEDKINIFEDRVLGWQLQIAEQLYYGPLLADGSRGQTIPHNGFAVLYILLSYLEMIPKMEDGDHSEDSGVWFKEGLRRVFPELGGHADEIAILSAMWKGARNGLYHSSMTRKQVYISGDAACIDYDAAKKRLVVNPGVVAHRMIGHFHAYTARLRDPSQVDLRDNFQSKFDADILPQIS